MSDENQNTPNGSPAADTAGLAAFADQQIERHYADRPLREVRLAQRLARTCNSAPEIVNTLHDFFAGGSAARGTSTPATASVVPPTAPSNTGAPAPTPGPSNGQLPDNPLLWPPDVVRACSAMEYRDALDSYERRQGRGDPLHGLRRHNRERQAQRDQANALAAGMARMLKGAG